MARPKKTVEAPSRTPSQVAAPEKTAKAGFRATIPQLIQGLLTYSSLAFFLVWLAIGIFLLLVIVQGLRRGAYEGLLSAGRPTPMPTEAPQTEADLPGIGRVNIACVQQALSPNSLQKIIQERKIDVLQGDERTKFEACIVQRETASPTAAATQ